jgi:hypothetical protein
MENVDKSENHDINDENLDRPLLIIKKNKKVDTSFMTRQGESGRK